MDFIHDPYHPGETIAAIATPPGEGGVAIIRISGYKAIEIADKIFTGPVTKYKSHTAHYGSVLDLGGQHVDDALALVMLGKKSYTGEDTVEIHCHGGSLITRRVLEVAIKAGARLAQPGEFTYKAFANGKLDLVQAEAVQRLIAAKNERALEAAENQLKGRLSKEITTFQRALTEIAAILEAWVDFPEEGLEFATVEDICRDLKSLCKRMRRLEDTYHDGKIIQEGRSLCLIGSPNVGKSSLMNALLDKDRAIVTHIPGTTRDILEDQMRLNGLHFRLIDTAGIRNGTDLIEQEGIRRSKNALRTADLILFVLDAHRGMEMQDQELVSLVPKQKTILVWNKTDLPYNGLPVLDFPHRVLISAKLKIGLDQLHTAIDQVIWENGPPSGDEVVITNARHKAALAQAIIFCEKVIEGLEEGISAELISMDMRHCLQELGKIIGTNIGEDILSAIFSKFCIGK